MITKWNIANPDEKMIDTLRSGGLTVPAAMALVSRGISTVSAAADFFGQDEEGSTADVFSDPFLIRDMEKACGLISEAADSGELICIYGDYDCDGITSTTVLYSYLRDIGANVITYINERDMGYGINPDAIRELSRQGVGTIITVDNGISAVAEAELCNELGITLIITDHHQAGEVLPAAEAVVDPHRHDCPSPFKHYCGCGLVLKLIAAMEGGDMDFAMEQYSDLAAIATIADVVPLTGENREIVRRGLHYLENTENPGLISLISKAGLKPPYRSSAAAFSLAPRINASGRIGSPMDAVRLLTAEDPDEAEGLAEKICTLNNQRKDFEDRIISDVDNYIRNNPAVLNGRILFVSGEGWHHGVIGIAAARCTERFGKPVFLMSWGESEDEARGSARSVEGFNIFKALSHCSDVLTKFGGHSGAGGFSCMREDLDEFNRLLEEYAAEVSSQGTPRRTITLSGRIDTADLTVESVSGLDVLEPFGEGNPRPVFLLTNAVITDIIPVSGGNHTKLTLRCGKNTFSGLMFGTKTAELPYKVNDTVNLAASPEINTFGGRTSVVLRIADIRRKGLNQQKMIAAEEIYHAFRRDEKIDERLIPKIIPQRTDLAAVYRAVGTDRLSPEAIYSRLADTDMNYCKFLICLDIFTESRLMEFDCCENKASVIKDAPKADTSLAPTMQKLSAYLI